MLLPIPKIRIFSSTLMPADQLISKLNCRVKPRFSATEMLSLRDVANNSQKCDFQGVLL
jgi:hypothetical protein